MIYRTQSRIPKETLETVPEETIIRQLGHTFINDISLEDLKKLIKITTEDLYQEGVILFKAHINIT